MNAALLIIVLGSAVYWLAQAWLRPRNARMLPRLSNLTYSPPLERWPTVSVIMPARNEAAQLGAALARRSEEGYPALELVVVDDRSEDGTGAVAAELAARDPRIQVARVDALPEGWLGKVHALQRGLERASGEWILFSDADVHVAPGTLARLIAWADQNDYDHIAVLPSARAPGRLAAPALAAFFRLFAVFAPLYQVIDPRSKAAMGSGAFNLFRRSALDASPGLPWLRMEIGDDVALGVMLKRAGAEQAVVVGEEHVSLDFYKGLGDVLRGLEKNGATAPLPAVLLLAALLCALEMGYLVGLFTGVPALQALALGTTLLASYTQDRVSRWLKLPRWPAVVPFLGAPILAFALARAALLATVRGGVRWRGTFYPTAALRAGARLGMYAKKDEGT